MSFSQGEEEAVIAEWAAGRRGGFLDLGCYDGVTYSNTAALAEAGWAGVCVDAAPDAVAACVQRYAKRKDIVVVCGAWRNRPSSDPVLIHWSPSQMYTSADPIPLHKVPEAPEYYVGAVDNDWLAWMVAKLPRPLFVSIDLEGSSVDALAWVASRLAPDCVCVEANSPGEFTRARTRARGMKVLWRNDYNAVFVS